MTAGSSKSQLLPRRVSDSTSDPSHQKITKPNEESLTVPSRKRPRPTEPRRHITRRVSQNFEADSRAKQTPYISSEDELDHPCHRAGNSVEDVDYSKLRERPAPQKRAVSIVEGTVSNSELETVSSVESMDSKTAAVPPLPNPLHHPKLLDVHIRAVRLEAELSPMRQIVARLMAHPTHNRRGIFNVPVDPVALGLPDYTTVIKKPMDLGTVKARLHAVAYQSRNNVAEDIRLVFENAIQYNPSQNFVHIAARNLLDFFEESYEVLQAKEVVPHSPGAVVNGGVSTVTPAGSISKPVNYGKAMKRALNVAAKIAKHICRSCLGRSCLICRQGCLSHEPALLICSGSNCAGAKIRKGAVYFISKDGTKQFCQRCYANLQAVLPQTTDQADGAGKFPRYKRDLLKRKNEEEVAERWLTCSSCNRGAHKVCLMHNEFVHSEDDFKCPECVGDNQEAPSKKAKAFESNDDIFTFVSGSDEPVELSSIASTDRYPWNAQSLPQCCISRFIEEKVRACMKRSGVANSEKSVSVRIISDCSKEFNVPDIIRKHFRMNAVDPEKSNGVVPPPAVRYSSKAIALFQKIDGLDVCIFCMYVQEYDGDDDFRGGDVGQQKKRVYIAYLDSVEHFRPRACRTSVYHEMLVSYLATARARGYTTAHIWACPPSRGNSFVFWNHPTSQRTPNKDRLISWYHSALNHAVKQGVVTDVRSLFESDFCFEVTEQTDASCANVSQETMKLLKEGTLGGRVICPPLLDGDFWIEEAMRLHGAAIARHLKSKPNPKDIKQAEACPAAQIAQLIQDRLIGNELSLPFRKPVNAAALNLLDYHIIIKKPMDLGTVHSKCVLGEYSTLREVVEDVELVFSNAMRYNPKGHYVHSAAVELKDLFCAELDTLTSRWPSSHMTSSAAGWASFADLSMSLDLEIEFPTPPVEALPKSANGMGMNDPIAKHAQPISTIKSPACVSSFTTLQPPPIALVASNPSSPDTSTVTMELSLPQNSSCQPRVLLPNSGRKPTKVTSPRVIRRSSNAFFELVNKKLELLNDGPDAIMQRMVGEDKWLMDKRTISHPKAAAKKKPNGKKKKEATEEIPTKRRKQSWLGEELALSVRRMRTSFFTCSLSTNDSMTPDEVSKSVEFENYISSFAGTAEDEIGVPSRLANARHALLEFSQFRNLEFDTLRRAKYSTAMILYHLHNNDAPGLIPECSSCKSNISEVRWHRIRRVEERHHTGRVPPSLRAAKIAQNAVAAAAEAEASHMGEELCVTCYQQQGKGDDFIPLPVSFKA